MVKWWRSDERVSIVWPALLVLLPGGILLWCIAYAVLAWRATRTNVKH